MRKKNKFQFDELDLAKKDFFNARDALILAETNFNNCVEDFFEIANMELSLAKMRVALCEKKVRLLMSE